MNQLDERRTLLVPDGTIIPNPARRLLEHELKLACTHEGEARRRLARRDEIDPDYEEQLANIDDALAEQAELVARRPTTPTHAPVEDTELAGKLRFHPAAYKTVLDTIRIACANVEGDLAEALAPNLPRASEAKKTLANLFAAPGIVTTDEKSLQVRLAPAATNPERNAFAQLCAQMTSERLQLPGLDRRLLRFEVQPT
jgi:hypothetical protein